MGRDQSPPSLCIVTPTFERRTLLKRFLKQLPKQEFQDWKLVVVHDGPNGRIKSLVGRFEASDPRIVFVETPDWNNDYGATPRLVGVQEARARFAPDYILFWDDDNSFEPDALCRIRDSLVAHDYPEVLIVSVDYRGREMLPPEGVSGYHLKIGQVDMACIIVRTWLAQAGYEAVVQAKWDNPGRDLFVQDWMLLAHVRERVPTPRIVVDRSIKVGTMDGLRRLHTWRRRWGLPSLGLTSQRWFRRLTEGVF
ncbi:glycosyltransferase family 2 protein [Paludisphaera rhizosphaerae]|uniref:glycosyltransferase family 2 protein n=1 Tax=Paludisphaera rhizosphaerae TaxID=2711216 RepID=UPI0013EB0E09|nr:glycosyltransferase [Paludisphaera rhizosphaerae]